MRSFYLGSVVSVLLYTMAWPASAQLSCENELLCPDGTRPRGDFPNCNCSDTPEPEPPEPLPPEPEPAPPEPTEPEPEPTPPTNTFPMCEVNFGCVDGDQIGFGEWPDCRCRDLETPILAPGERIVPDPGIPPGLGMEETCKMFYTCSTGYEMIVWNDRCVCGEQMLEPPEE